MGIKVHEVNQNSFLRVSSISPHSFEVSFKVRNTGKYDGEEVSQLYLRDEYASVVQPLKQLKYFERFYLKCGEVKEVKFVLSESDFTIIDRNLKTVVEPGTFQIIVGTASNDIRLQAKVVVRYRYSIEKTLKSSPGNSEYLLSDGDFSFTKGEFVVDDKPLYFSLMNIRYPPFPVFSCHHMHRQHNIMRLRSKEQRMKPKQTVQQHLLPCRQPQVPYV